MMLDEQAEKGTQLGWITGFTWSRLQIIDYQQYREVVHGSVPKDLIPIVFRKLKTSRSFNEHILVDIFKFVNLIILLIGLILLLIGLGQREENEEHNHLQTIGLGILLFGWFMKQFEECVGCFGSLRLKKKIRDLVQELNRELEPAGIILRFPIHPRKLFFAFRWNLCRSINYDTLEIWSLEEELQPLNPIRTQNKQNPSRASKLRSKGQKIDEDESVYV